MEHQTSSSGKSTLTAGIVIAVAIVTGAWIYRNGSQYNTANTSGSPRAGQAARSDGSDLEREVIPAEGIELPITWGDLGKRMVAAGVIDDQQMRDLYAQRGGLDTSELAMLEGSVNGPIRLTRDNASFVLNMLWAVGLSQESDILTRGEMTDQRYGGDASQFASTGGWTLSRGNAMRHYAAHRFLSLTPEQQALVQRVSRGIYRPCCDNPTHFPDCNHGMAMLGLLELLAANGVSESDIYRVALRVNAYWFPSQYLTIAQYLKAQGSSWSAADPKEILGKDYSSSSGYRRILSQVRPVAPSGNGGCGV